MKTFGEKFKMLRLKRGLTQDELAHEFNYKYKYSFSKSSISQYENNRRLPEIEALKSFASYFCVSIDWLLGLTPSCDIVKQMVKIPQKCELYGSTDLIFIPLLNAIRPGKPIPAGQDIIEYIPWHCKSPGSNEYFALKVNDDSMNLSQIIEGSIVVINCCNNVENSEIVIVTVDSKNVLIRKYFNEADIVILVPNSNNKIYQLEIINTANVEVKVIGKIVQSIINQ